MNASKFSDAPKAFIQKEGAEGTLVAEVFCRVEISQATYFNWKNRFDGMTPPGVRRLNQPKPRTGSCGSWWRTRR